LQDGRGERRGALRRRIGMGLAAVIFLGAAGSAWAGWRLHRLEGQVVATGEQIRVTRTAIEAATARTEESAGYAKLVAQKKSAVPAVVLVDQLSQAIPTSTYLAQLVFGSEELRIAGLSSDPAGLIAILEGAESLADVRFAAPTVSGEGEGQDRFEIIAKVISPGVATQ
jgi:general secretion pathway protein L